MNIDSDKYLNFSKLQQKCQNLFQSSENYGVEFKQFSRKIMFGIMSYQVMIFEIKKVYPEKFQKSFKGIYHFIFSLTV